MVLVKDSPSPHSLFRQADAFDIALAGLSVALSFLFDKVQWRELAAGIPFLDENLHLLVGFAAMIGFGIAVPRTHLRSLGWNRFWQPFQGGTPFVTLQSASWTFFAIALSMTSLCLFSSAFGLETIVLLGETYRIWIYAGIFGFIAELLMICSIYSYSHTAPVMGKRNGWNHLSVLALLLTVFALLQSLLLEAGISPEVHNWLKIGVIISITAAVSLTHLLVGRLYHDSNWKLYQPFVGGWRFVCIQILSWTSFAVAILTAGICTLLSFLAPQLLYQGGWIIVGLLGLVAEASMIASIPSYSVAEQMESQNLIQSIIKGLMQLRMIAVTWLFFNMHYISTLSAFFPLCFFSFNTWVIGLAIIAPIYMIFCKYSVSIPWDILEFRKSWAVKDIRSYFCGRVIATEKLEEGKQYVFGIHPHGTLPATAIWCHNNEEWKEKVLKKNLITLAGSQVFYLPVMRELILAAGGRMVTREMFSKVLERGDSVLLVPGGVAEMKFSNSVNKEISVITKHKGFIRFALKHGADLVPVFSFGETQVLDYFCPSIQNIFFRYLGIPFPVFIGKCIQMPRACDITVAVGKPIHVEKKDVITEEYVDEIHRKYFQSLHELFETHKASCGHDQHQLKLMDFELSSNTQECK